MAVARFTLQRERTSPCVFSDAPLRHEPHPPAITACTTACESVCRIALDRLSLPLPKDKQLPDYLKALCDQTNIRALAGVGGAKGTKRVFGNLQGLAQNSYLAAHQLGDRHAGGDSAPIFSLLPVPR